jgi:hypothetical protein
MRLQISDLTTERKWRAATGTNQARFEKLLVLFTVSYFELHGKTLAQRQADSVGTASIQSEQELLLFTLFSLKAGLTYDLLGLVCGLDGSNAQRQQQLGLRVLEAALRTAQCLPARTFAHAEEFATYLQQEAELIFDGVEQRMQRPREHAVQKDFHSGKKSAIPSKPSL